MKSMGCLAALLKDIMEFSLIAFILRSVDCKIFIPFPLCPNTKNFGVLNAASLFNSTPAKKTQNPHQESPRINQKSSPFGNLPLEKRVEQREREAFSGTWSRLGTSET
jgi:hypothetical protein